MSDDEIIAINRDTFFATDDTAAHWLAFGRAIERRTLERAANECDGHAAWCKSIAETEGKISAMNCAIKIRTLVTK